jgi:hypothetical protein
MSEQFPRLDEFVRFVNERWSIHLKRTEGLPAPWTKDPILQKYRFTNVRREDDRVTRWIHEQWLRDRATDELWLAFYVSRVFNKPETLAAIGWPLPWSAATKKRVYTAIKKRQANGERVFNAAYIVSSHGRATCSKTEYYMEIFDELWARRKVVRPVHGDSLESFFSRLCEQPGIGGFMGAQVVADIKAYEPLYGSDDLYTFARSGPGSRRGMHWVRGTEPLPRYNESAWQADLLLLMAAVRPKLKVSLDAQNLQNCLCEFSKYCKVKFNGGRAKQIFRPSVAAYTSL